MHRQHLLANLAAFDAILATEILRHKSFDETEEREAVRRLRKFVETTPDCFARESLAGHITGSALVTNFDFSEVLLTLHGKLNIWLQLGGHADGEAHVEQVALRETFEEAGIGKLKLANLEPWARRLGLFPEVQGTTWLPFDVDVHLIPARKTEPEHLHYDVRYLVIADSQAQIAISDESHDLRWMSLNEARKVTSERSMHRQFDKLLHLAEFAKRGELPVKEYFLS